MGCVGTLAEIVHFSAWCMKDTNPLQHFQGIPVSNDLLILIGFIACFFLVFCVKLISDGPSTHFRQS